MTNIWKRSLSMFLAFVMVFGMIPVNAFAVEEELVEEVLVEELVEEEIFEEEIFEEEVFEEEVFEEETEEEEPVEVTVEEYHETDDVAAAALTKTEGTILVNGYDVMGAVEALLQDGQEIKKAVLNGLDITDYDAYTVEYPWTATDEETGFTYSGVTDVTSEKFTDGEIGVWQILGDDLQEKILAGDPKTATFLVNGQEVVITFGDSRLNSIKITLAAFEIANKGEMKQSEVEAWIAEYIENNLKVTAIDPADGTTVDVDLAECDVEIGYYDAEGEYCAFQWPAVGESAECVEVIITVYNPEIFNQDKEAEAKVAYVYGTLKDTRGIFDVTYKTYYAWDYDFEEEPATSKTYNVAENDPTPVHTPVMENMEFYTLGDWDPTPVATVTGNAEYVAVWSPVLDENYNDEADQVERFTIRFYDGNTKIGEVKNVKWGDTEKIQEKVDEMKADGKLDKDEMFFAGWSLEKNGEEVIELPDAVTAPEDGNTWKYYGVWTDNYVVKFADPTAGERSSDGIAYNKIGKTEMVESDNETPVEMPTEWENVLGWKVLGETALYNFATPVTANLTLIPMVDSNNDGKEDGTAADPIYTYIYQNNKGAEVERYYLLENEKDDHSAPDYPEQANDKTTCVDWNEPETVGRVSTFKPVMADDKNNNEVADADETVVVTVTGNGTVEIDGVAVVSGESFVYNSKVNNVKVNNVVKAIPAMNGEFTETYVSEFSLAGGKLNYAADYSVSCDLNGATTVSVVFADAIEEKINPVMDTADVAYKSKVVYDAVVAAPSSANGEVTAYYLAREYDPAHAKVNLNSLKGMFDSAVTRMLEVFDESEAELRAILDTKFESVTTNGYYSDFDSADAWIAVEEAGNVKGTLNNGKDNTPQNAADEWIEVTKQKAANDPIKYFGPYVDFESAQNTVDNLVDGLMVELNEALSGSNMHRFGEKQTESVKVTYKDDTRYAESEAVTLELKETRIGTGIEGSIKPVNYTGKALSVDTLLANIKVVAENDEVFKPVLNGVDAGEFINAGTHTVPVKFEPEGAIDGVTYKASYATFTLTINRVNSNLSFGGNTLVAQGQEINPFPQVAEGAEYVHLIAGVEIDPAKVDLKNGELLGAVTAKAWIKIPDSLKSMAEGMMDDLKTGSYKLSDLIAKLESYEEIFAEVGADIDDIIEKLNKVNSMVAQTNGLVPELKIDLEIVEGNTYGPKNIGVYMNMAIVTDSNYFMAKDDCIMLVHPGAMPSKNGFQIEDANGAQNVFTSTSGLKVKLDGTVVDVPLQYFGISTTGNIVMNAETPTAAGMYVVSAVYETENVYTDAAVLVIAPKDSSVTVTSDVVKSEAGKSFAPAIKATTGASTVKISAGVDVPGKTAVVNIDMPTKAVKIVNALLGKLGEKLPNDITLSELITKLEAAPAAIEAKIPMETLEEMGLDSIAVGDKNVSVDDVMKVIEKTVEALVEPLKDAQAMLRGADAVLTFEHNKKYSEPGVYFYAAAVIDPEYMPDFDAGYLVIEDANFVAEKMIVTEAEAKAGYEVKPSNDAGRGFIAVINDGNGNWNLQLDGRIEKKVLDKLEQKFGKNLDGATATVAELIELAEKAADNKIAQKAWSTLTAEAVYETMREEALEKIDTYVDKYLGSRTAPLADKIIAYLTEVVDARLAPVVDKADEILSAINERKDNKLTINGALPTKIGTYKVHFLSYAVAYETADLQIVDGLFKLFAANVALYDTLDMSFALKTSDLKGSTEYYAELTRTYADGRADDVRIIPYAEWKTNGSYKTFTYDGLAAKEMADEIYITIYHNDGTPASYEWIDSIQLYANRLLNPAPGKAQPTAELKRVLVDMLNYGVEAQKHFKYNQEDLADALLSDEHKACASGDVAHADYRVKGNNYVGTSVITTSSLVVQFAFKNLNANHTAYITYTDHYGKPVSLTVAGTEFVDNNGFDVIWVTGMAIADGRSLITCEVKDGETVVASIVDSIESYADRMGEDTITAYRLLQFADSAAAYFKSIKK